MLSHKQTLNHVTGHEEIVILEASEIELTAKKCRYVYASRDTNRAVEMIHFHSCEPPLIVDYVEMGRDTPDQKIYHLTLAAVDEELLCQRLNGSC